MDKGRIIDNIQNTNARYIDNFGATNKTTVKTSNPPGGKSSFSLGWGNDNSTSYVTKNTKNSNQNQNFSQKQTNDYDYLDNYMGKKENKNVPSSTVQTNNSKTYNQQTGEKTGVRVRYAPGGQSSIVFGDNNK